MSRPERVINHIERTGIEPHSLDGFVLKAGSELMLVAKFFDFFFDGYTIIRRRDITLRRVNAVERYFTKIIEAENLHREVEWDIDIPVESWESIFRWLEAQNKFVIVEDGEEGLANIGPMVRVESDFVEIHWFDADGKWGEMGSTPFEDVVSISFDSNYLTYQAKYILREPPL
jgi:hypothetical protein